MDALLLHQVSRDEGRSPVVYKDSRGLWTIADGILVDFRKDLAPGAGLRDEEMDFILNNRLNIAAVDAMDVLGQVCLAAMGLPRQRAIINMCFNLGEGGFHKFTKLRAALLAGNYTVAAAEMKASEWYVQVGLRGDRLVNQMLTGVDQ